MTAITDFNAPLAPLDVAPRLGRLREHFDAAGIDALLVTKLANVRYLTGFTGSAALLLVTPTAARFVTDGRYSQRSREELDAAGVHNVEIEIGLTAAAQRAALIAAVPGLAAATVGGNHRARVRDRTRVRNARARSEWEQLRSHHRIGPERFEAARDPE